MHNQAQFSDLYSFHKSHSSQVIIYLTFRYISQMYQGVFTQCRHVAHNSRFSVLPQSVESFLFTFQYLHLWGIIFIPILAQYGAFTIPYICCFVRGIYHPAHFEWGIYSSHSWLLFVAHYISHHKGVYKFTRDTFPSRFIIYNFSGLMGRLSFP